MIKELDIVVLTRDLPGHGMKRGAVGTVVMVYGDGKAFEVEFVSSDGGTIALEPLIFRPRSRLNSPCVFLTAHLPDPMMPTLSTGGPSI